MPLCSQSLADCQAVNVAFNNVYWNMYRNTSDSIKHQLDGITVSTIALHSSKRSLSIGMVEDCLMKGVGLELALEDGYT